VNRHPTRRISHRYFATKIKAALMELNLANATLHVTFASDAVVRRQNRLHRQMDYTTDVLSFPSLQPQKMRQSYNHQFLGDILVSLDQAARQAKVQKLKLEQEVLFLIIHSILHLIGYDHANPTETKQMQKLESQLWKVLA